MVKAMTDHGRPWRSSFLEAHLCVGGSFLVKAATILVDCDQFVADSSADVIRFWLILLDLGCQNEAKLAQK